MSLHPHTNLRRSFVADCGRARQFYPLYRSRYYVPTTTEERNRREVEKHKDKDEDEDICNGRYWEARFLRELCFLVKKQARYTKDREAF